MVVWVKDPMTLHCGAAVGKIRGAAAKQLRCNADIEASLQ